MFRNIGISYRFVIATVLAVMVVLFATQFTTFNYVKQTLRSAEENEISEIYENVLASVQAEGRVGRAMSALVAGIRHCSRRSLSCRRSRSGEEAQARPGHRIVSPTALIPSLQADALAREIEQQLKDETGAARQAAEREAQAIVAHARKTARTRLHEAIRQLRREGERRLMQGRAQLEMQARAAQQREAARAVADAMPLLREAMTARWKDAEARRRWTESIAKFCATRLHPGQWTVTHPADWSANEQKDFAKHLGGNAKVELTFKTDKKLSAGLKVASDQAMLDATLAGLLADERATAGLLLQAIDHGAGA